MRTSSIPSVSLPAHRATAAGLEASSRAHRQASSTALPRLPENAEPAAARRPFQLEFVRADAAGSSSPSAANASTSCRPPGGRWPARTGSRSSAVPVSSANSRSAASAGVSPGSTSPFGIIHAPASLLRQNGPPGLISRTSSFAVPLAEQQDARAMRRRHPARTARSRSRAIQPPPSSRVPS